ncbi:hypothetical protein AB5J49_44020 [Streptomyces sp. R28]|uniref:Uncharacterized protein n=1 Tax=Streptomyces sp. R28 TaxID=3238628 RepID=A0AB39QAD9_9ACTN
MVNRPAHNSAISAGRASSGFLGLPAPGQPPLGQRQLIAIDDLLPSPFNAGGRYDASR